MTFRAIHYRQVCQYGFTHGQCRCPRRTRPSTGSSAHPRHPRPTGPT
jgi:hypothetical protein